MSSDSRRCSIYSRPEADIVTVPGRLAFCSVSCNFHEFWSVVRSRWNILNLTQSEHAVDDFAKDDVLPVEEIARCGRDEEL